VIWKDYSPSHFCGATGTFNGIDESIPQAPPRQKCEPASVGEFWCARLSLAGTLPSAHCGMSAGGRLCEGPGST
jgi:hypothetical protein